MGGEGGVRKRRIVVKWLGERRRWVGWELSRRWRGLGDGRDIGGMNGVVEEGKGGEGGVGDDSW